MKKSVVILVLLWVLSMIALLTPKLSRPFTIFEPYSYEYYVIVFGFIVSSLGLIKSSKTKVLVTPHLFVTFLIILLHPNSTLLGRDGTVIILCLYFIFALWIILENSFAFKLLFTSLLLSLFILDVGIPLIEKKADKARTDLMDFGDMVSGFREGGYLLPDLNTKIVGEFQDSKVITNKYGFRNEKEIKYEKPDDLHRIILLGDSFVAGYRTDQSQTIGKVLENELNKNIGKKFEVLIAGSEHPGQYQQYINLHAFKFKPNMVIVGITLGNDISQAYLSEKRVKL